MMKKLLAFSLLIIYANLSFACSTFLLKNKNQIVFGKNYDWITGNGMVVINNKGLQKTSFTAPGEIPVSWISKWGSITFNQFGKEFPNGGMNEKGLVVELMWLPGTTYPAKDNRAAINELQWIQYQLDNHTTVDDVIISDKNIRISNNNFAPLHYLIADAKGNAATIEFIDGNLVVHQGKDLEYPVLTNTIYKDALQQHKSNKETVDNSVHRFRTACNMVQQFQKMPDHQNGVDYAFNILDKVAQGSYTRWSIVYDITNMEIHFLTDSKKRNISFKQFDFACNNNTLFYNLSSSGTGMVAKAFTTLGFLENKDVLFQSVKESGNRINVPELALNSAAAYYNQARCKQ